MMPMLPFSPPPSVVNAYARVDKATSEFLNCPDWRINIGICDTINSKPWLSRDYLKAVRTRIQHKNPNVQLLSLTLLETILNNCTSEHVHYQIAERKILQEMIKIVKKKAHMRVREKILVLIDAWQEAYSGRGGKITAQYYRAYEELRRCGVDFPQRSPNSDLVITPLVSYGHHQAGASSSTRHEPVETVSLSMLESMRDTLHLLHEMLQEVNPKDRKAVKDEVITDLYNQCRSNQKKLGYTLSSTTDEEILHQGIHFNDAALYVIGKHDAIASGSPIPVQPPGLMTQRPRVKHVESKEACTSSASPSSTRCVELRTIVPQDHARASTSITDKKVNSDPSLLMDLVPLEPDASLVMDIVPSDPPPLPANQKTAEEDMIDLLTLALSPATPSTSNSNQTPNGSTGAETQPPVQPLTNNYIVPWAQTQLQLEYEPQPPSQIVQPQSNYILPPWPPTPGYYCNPCASNHPPSSYYNHGSGSGAGSDQYIPSYRILEDLNVVGNLSTSNTPGASGPSMLGARK